MIKRKRGSLSKRLGASQTSEFEMFLYSVAHDLRAPFNAIFLTADALLCSTQVALTDAVRADLARVVRTAARGEQMLSDLLRLFRAASEKDPEEVVDLEALVNELVDVLEPEIRARRVRVSCGRLPVVRGQPSRLRHVLSNLLENAVRYVPEGRGEITVSGRRGAGWVVLRVRDNGFGIPTEYHDRIFELFGKGPPPPGPTNGGSASHTGLGLALVRRIVEAEGGTVRVESMPGAGTCFLVRLPEGAGSWESVARPDAPPLS